MQASSNRSLPSLSLRIDLDPKGRIGPGKIQLLESIQTCGSISAAGRAMDMSYKRAWDLVDEINRICRHAAVARQTGGKNGGGAVLTPFGVSWLFAIARWNAMPPARSTRNSRRCETTSGARKKARNETGTSRLDPAAP